MTDTLEEAIRKRQEFHGYLPDKVIKIKIDRNIPKNLVVLGKCKSISYEPIGKTNKKPGEYIHRFGDWGLTFEPNSEPLLCCSSDGKSLYLIGGHYDVRKWIYG